MDIEKLFEIARLGRQATLDPGVFVDRRREDDDELERLDKWQAHALEVAVKAAFASSEKEEKLTESEESWVEWGIRRTWGAVGTISPMDEVTAKQCAENWPAELINRKVNAGPWTVVDSTDTP